MNEVWKRIFEQWIQAYESIKTLEKIGIMDDFEEVMTYRHKLLQEIIVTVKDELESN